MKQISVGLSKSGIAHLQREIEEYQKWLEVKADELAKRLAEIGVTHAESLFSMAQYDGIQDYHLSVEPLGDKQYKVLADGETVLFVEFGTGLIGYGHPEVQEFGPGTYPEGLGYWDNPQGWDIPQEKGGQHTYGNPPNAPMYNTVRYLEQEFERIVQEVFTE